MTPAAEPVSQHMLTVNGVDFAYFAAVTAALSHCVCTVFLTVPTPGATSFHFWHRRAIGRSLRSCAVMHPAGCPMTGATTSESCAIDAIEFHRALGGDEPGVIIGHDWGAPIAHSAANHAPERWAKVVTMAVPPGGALNVALATNLTQLKRSWYFFFFLHELSNIVVAADDLAFVDLLWSDWSPGFDATNEVPNVKNSLRDPDNLSAALGYYRAALGTGLIDPALEDVRAAAGRAPSQPMLYLHRRERRLHRQ